METKRQEVDVNITPDKRQVLFENEKFLLATVRYEKGSRLDHKICKTFVGRGINFVTIIKCDRSHINITQEGGSLI